MLRVCLYLCVVLCFGGPCVSAYNPVCGVFVTNADTGDVVYSYNADKKTQPASLTKMMTLKLVFREIKRKKLRPATKIRVSRRASAQSPTKLGLRAGDTITVRDAILSLITKSANDMAVALAEHIGGNVENFVKMMNAEAVRLGMKSTHFENPSGWKSTKQYTTARDMSKLSRSLLKECPDFYHLFATKSFNYNQTRILNHNKLLGRHGMGSGKDYFVVDGIKTGYVAASGFNLAASATDGKIRLIAVVLGGKTAEQRDAHVNLLLQKGFPRMHALLERKAKKRNSTVLAYGEMASRRAYIQQVGVMKPAVVIERARHSVSRKVRKKFCMKKCIRVKKRRV